MSVICIQLIDIMLRLYKSLVRPHVEYCSSVWSPYFKKDKEQIERIQHRFRRLIPSIKHMTYDERLAKLGLWSLEEPRNRADLIETFKLVKGMTRVPYEVFFEIDHSARTRRHSYRIVKKRFTTTSRQFSFSQRVVNCWNALDQDTVDEKSLNGFNPFSTNFFVCYNR